MLFASPVDDGQGTVTNHFLSYLDITRRYVAELDLRTLTSELEARVAARTRELEAVNSRLSALVAEREMLLVEVNHRAKNSLAIAASSWQSRADVNLIRPSGPCLRRPRIVSTPWRGCTTFSASRRRLNGRRLRVRGRSVPSAEADHGKR